MSVTQSTSIAALAKALVKAQGSLKPAGRFSVNPFFKSSYADLESVWDACREALQAQGLAITQFPGYEAGSPPFATLTTILTHESGEWIAGTAGAPIKAMDAQGIGSALTYLRRYALAAVVGVIQADDDGVEASQGKAKKAERGATSTVPQGSKGSGTAATASPPPGPTSPAVEKLAVRELTYKGQPLTELKNEDLVALRDWARKKGGDKTAFADRADEILEQRRTA